jgi:transglutaminase-like putative cysteine protease
MPETAARTDRTRLNPTGPGVLAAAATLIAVWSYTGAVTPGMWTFVVCAVVIVVAVAGILTRLALRTARAGLRAPIVLVVQLLAAVVACTVLLARETAWMGLLPTEMTVRLIGVRLQQSGEEIMNGVAPIAASLPMATLLGLAFAVVAILIDQLVAHRLVMLAVLLTSVVGVMPMLISFGSVNLGWFLLQAIMILLLLRFGARHDAHAPRPTSYLVATSTGLVAVLVTLVLGPALPVASALPGTGPMLTVSADLRLGDDLRRPEGIEALTVVTSAATPPYLRMATLSRFDGEVWRPDRGDRVALRDGFGEREWADPIKTVETDVSIRVLGVSSERLPVPYAPERLSGVEGTWSAVPENRTVVSGTSDAAGADYTVHAATPVPTLEQIRASSASGAPVTELPGDLPPIIGELAREVTADADTDYDRMIALQDWFRSDFTYSLDAPVEEGFDGTGADAVATFLEKRTGYCIHFAGAFALMADTLGMPVRIVVGYLPGSGTDQKRDDSIVYSVTSDQLHSWPEVHFAGIGWVPFEPTATLGVPTDFIAASSSGGSGDGPEAPTPTITPTTGPSAAPTDEAGRNQDVGGGGTDALQTLNPTPVTLTVLGVLVLLLLPALVRELWRVTRMGRARSGDAMAAWRELSDTLIDLGLASPEAQTARVRAEMLASKRGTDPDALAPLVAAVERASYAPSAPDAGDLAVPLRVVIGQLAASVDGRERLLARLLPASLFARRR